MVSSSSSIILRCLVLLITVSTLSTAVSHGKSRNHSQTFQANKELQKLKRIRSYLKRINKPSVKIIQACLFFLSFPYQNLFFSFSFHFILINVLSLQSPDGDVIDCVPCHLQPAFDHPDLKGQKPLDPPERPKGYTNLSNSKIESIQLWSSLGESCPEGTIPIRRTTEEDVLRVGSYRRFGRKPRRFARRDSTGSRHEHAVAFINGDQFYGAKASINVWAPEVTDTNEFSLSQIWVISGSFGNDLNTLEAGWQANAYQATGCYNLLCSGFVQTNNRVAMGAAISPRSLLNEKQFDISVMDPKHGHWWLEFGNRLVVGYWPANLFTHLRSHADMIQFGGEIVNTNSMGFHTSTQMGSGHFPDQGFKKAAYFRNLQVIDWDNNLIPTSNLQLLADHPNCYDIVQGKSDVWGDYFYYGGPGRNVRCP
ncbi:hypothetical protein V2J09_011982 [Rumex salicifolius]